MGQEHRVTIQRVGLMMSMMRMLTDPERLP